MKEKKRNHTSTTKIHGRISLYPWNKDERKKTEAIRYLYDYIKTRTSAWKNSISKVKRKITDWENYFQLIAQQRVNFLIILRTFRNQLEKYQH